MTTAQAIALLLGILVSPVTGLLTKAHAPAGVKAFVNLALSALAGVVTTVTVADGASWKGYVTAIGYAWVVSIATHYGLWKPTGVTAAVAGTAPNTGLGSNVPVSEGPPDEPTKLVDPPRKTTTRKRTTTSKS